MPCISDAGPRVPHMCLFPQRKSVHYTGSEIMFLSRDDIQAAGMGIYRITIKGFKADKEYALTIEYTSTERRPSPEEQQVLENIYSTCCYAGVCLDLAPYVEASGYGAVENFCHAPYQSCDKDGHILALRLPGQELDCMLPESVGDLAYLQRLDLEDNYIQGDVGSVFSTLEDVPLHSLHMGLNYLSGKLPCLPTEADVPLSGLAYIDFTANHINQEIEACFFTPALEIVNLRGNFLTGLFPKSLPSSTKMLHLDLSWQDEEDHLTGELPDFTVWPNLEHLNVARNRINGSFPVLPDSLVVLRLHENRIDGEMPSSLGQFPRLMMLDVANNRLSGPLPETLPDTLVSLKMTENQFTGPIHGMEWFGHYEGPRALQELRLGGNRLTGLIPPELGQLGELLVLDLRNNLLEGSMEIFVEGIDDGNKLVNLNLAGNGITGTIPEGISKLHSFQDDYEPPPFWEGQKAAVFDISNNKLQGQIPAALLKAAAEEDRELKFEISGNSLECPQEYLGIFGGHESELEAAGGLRGTTCIDRSGNMVLLSEDQEKRRPGNLVWDDALEEWVPDLDSVPDPDSWDYTDDDYADDENEEETDEEEDADDDDEGDEDEDEDDDENENENDEEEEDDGDDGDEDDEEEEDDDDDEDDGDEDGEDGEESDDEEEEEDDDDGDEDDEEKEEDDEDDDENDDENDDDEGEDDEDEDDGDEDDDEEEDDNDEDDDEEDEEDDDEEDDDDSDDEDDDGEDNEENDDEEEEEEKGEEGNTDDGEKEGADDEEKEGGDDVEEKAAADDVNAEDVDAVDVKEEVVNDDGEGTGERENLTDEVLEGLSPTEDVLLSGRGGIDGVTDDLDPSSGSQKEGTRSVPFILIVVIAVGCVAGIAAVVGAAVAGVYWHRRKTGQAYRDYDENGLAMTVQEPHDGPMDSSDPPPQW